MRPRFEEHLEIMGNLAKEEMREDLTSQEESNIEGALAWHTQKRARDSGTTIDVQSEIFDLQRKKQEVMAVLKEAIKHLNDAEYIPETPASGRRVMFNSGNNTYYQTERGMDPVTIGEIMTDGEWGINYELDSETVPRRERKRYLIEQAKAELRDYLDQQIIAEESTSERTHGWKQEAYKKAQEAREAEPRQAGLIAEKMVRNFLKKLALDHGLDYEIIETDIFQDVEQKMDFIIRRKLHNRGVKVETDEKIESLGVQFTINSTKEKREEKEKQIERSRRALGKESEIQDIVLVQISIDDVMRIYHDWSRGQKSGGPDKLLPSGVKEKIFNATLGGLLKPKELAEQWSAANQPKSREYAAAA